MQREAIEFSVLIGGGGPAGLAAAIRLKQLGAQHNREIGVCVIEKGSEIGGHILSGAVMDPRAFNELDPEWKENGAPLNVPAQEDRFLFLSEHGGWQMPNRLPPDRFRNHGNYVVAWAMSAAGWANVPKKWGSRSIPDLAGRKCSTTSAAPSRGSPQRGRCRLCDSRYQLICRGRHQGHGADR